jgi:hypothetical protein
MNELMSEHRHAPVSPAEHIFQTEIFLRVNFTEAHYFPTIQHD